MANKIQFSLMLLFASAIPTLGLFAPLSMAAIFLILSIYPTFIFIKHGKFKTIWADSNLNKLIIIALAYALLSSVWAIKPSQSLNLWIRMALLFLGSLSLFYYATQIPEKEKLLKCLLWGVITAIFVANIELFTGGEITRSLRLYTGRFNPAQNDYIVEMNRGASILAVFIWAVFCYLWGKGQTKTSILLYITSLLTIFRMESLSTTLAIFIAGAFIFPLVLFFGKNILKIFAVIAVIAVFAVATAASLLDAHKLVGNVPTISGAASDIRLYIYDYTAKQALKKPILGWGFNASRNYPVEPKDYVQNGRSPLPLHPHNNTLQIWLELGAVGLIMFAGFLALFLLKLASSKHFGYQVATQTGLFATFFITGQTGYGLWQNWWVASALIASTFLVVALKQDTRNL